MDSLGWVYFKLGQHEEALQILLKAVPLVKDDPVVFEHIGDIYQSMGLREKAKEFWEKARASHAKSEEEGLKERVEKKLQESR
jgi:tetratricopeptide (TPR) repeat protein